MVAPEVRDTVIERDDGVCRDCGSPVGVGPGREGEVHHLKPRSEGGSDGLENLVLLCRSCHGGRHADGESKDEGRALLTEREREILGGEADVTDNYRYKVQSIVRNRVRKRLADDVSVLRECFPEVYEMLHDDVCGGASDGTTAEPPATPVVDAAHARRLVDRLEVALERGDRETVEETLTELREVLADD